MDALPLISILALIFAFIFMSEVFRLKREIRKLKKLMKHLTGELELLKNREKTVNKWAKNIMSDTADVDFDVLGADSEKILGAVSKGDGDNLAASDANDSVGFDENALIGSRFSVTCISATAGIAWIAHDILDGIAANTAGINLK